MHHYHVKNDEFLAKLKAVKPFQSKEGMRFYLCGIYLHEVDDALTLVATDGHTLIKATLAAEPATDNSGKLDFILPSESVDHLIKILSKRKEAAVLVDIDGGQATFDFGDIKYTAKAIDGTFPDYPRVFPDVKSSYSLNAQYLVRALNALGGKAVDMSQPENESDPRVLTSSETEGIACVIMPTRVK